MYREALRAAVHGVTKKSPWKVGCDWVTELNWKWILSLPNQHKLNVEKFAFADDIIVSHENPRHYYKKLSHRMW